MLKKSGTPEKSPLSRLRGGIMSRIGWFTYLRVIFGNTTHAPSPMDFYISKPDFLRRTYKEQYVGNFSFFLKRIKSTKE